MPCSAAQGARRRGVCFGCQLLSPGKGCDFFISRKDTQKIRKRTPGNIFFEMVSFAFCGLHQVFVGADLRKK
jgi:hypothetical protein